MNTNILFVIIIVVVVIISNIIGLIVIINNCSQRVNKKSSITLILEHLFKIRLWSAKNNLETPILCHRPMWSIHLGRCVSDVFGFAPA